MMPAEQTAASVLERHFLELRCTLLDIAAAFDRLERAGDFPAIARDPRLVKLKQGLEILQSSGDDRAERIQMLFSDPYVEGWKRG
jgi:hypothetical protein